MNLREPCDYIRENNPAALIIKLCICDLAGENGPVGSIGCYYHKRP